MYLTTVRKEWVPLAQGAAEAETSQEQMGVKQPSRGSRFLSLLKFLNRQSILIVLMPHTPC